VHQLLVDLIGQSGAEPGAANYTAHVIFGALRAEVIATLLASGRSEDELASDLTALTSRLLRIEARSS
jgi:hypothetical protein